MRYTSSVDNAIQALADPIRREILRMVREAPLSAGAIAGAFSVSRPAVSRHLRVLREAGLVIDEASGRERVYRLELAPLAEVEAYLAELRVSPESERAAWERRFMALETEVYRVRAQPKAARTKPIDDRKKETG
ncbi:MAG: winged helix-turn-helix transcriptional regulator [Myxococcales bacterium]|nr:winged helix-turn-helix transcriptional regulator [Myxococcales bacterium]